MTRPRRFPLIALAVLGVALIAMPGVFGLFARAPKGATMISAFKPYMTNARLDRYQQDIRVIDAGVRQADGPVAAFLAGPAAGGQKAFAARYPQVASFAQQWPPIRTDMTHMLSTIQANVGNYRAVAALPSFTLFPWFFVIPGALLLAAVALAARRRRPAWRSVRWFVIALGLGLVLAPAVFQMFSRAPRGANMVNAFTTIETRPNVERIQGYFATIAVGQGAVRLQLAPALARRGLTTNRLAARFPAVNELDNQWIPILGDLTPMIGTMSDDVVNYQAVAALPPFWMFPWFFVLPGLLVVGLAVAAQPLRGRRPAAAQHRGERSSIAKSQRESPA